MKYYKLPLGPEAIQKLLPQRRPFLFVDRVTDLAFEPLPSLRAQRFISANESIFNGHFPSLTLWPGAMTWEGLGQTTSLLGTLMEIWKQFEKKGVERQEFCKTLVNLEHVLTHHPNQDIEHLELLKEFKLREGMPFGVAGAVNIKFLAPVYAGCRLDYEVILTKILGQTYHFQLQAKVDEKLVAKGTMVSAIRLASFG